ncbi:MAG: Rieske 2Fe-2S domain-containing protein [Candidatus Cybelea sp.]
MSKRLWGIAAAFVVSVLGSAALAVAYATNAGPHYQGLGLSIALAGLALGIALWALGAMPETTIAEAIDAYPSSGDERAGAEKALDRGIDEVDRHGFLIGFLLAAIGSLGIAALFPLRSLSPRFGKGLYHTKWRRGSRVVLADGTPVNASDLEVGSVLTVFPEGSGGDASSQTLLLRLPLNLLQPVPARADWSPRGYIAFSKVCTHAGCPVGLYRASVHQLLCPCHQSVFDVARAAAPISGPAARALPQLPLQIAGDGSLSAQSDYTEPIGPGFWQRR